MAKPMGAKKLAEEMWKAQKKYGQQPRCSICGEPIPSKEDAFLGRKG
ncbi:hypothetical protein [Thermosulfurimonas dismutans]|uniref:Uncharacterized protein n=1 Tax=Thermosulfurimonas dismutans TaxID=999894 RepID=A0A179D5A5_9BACT|nr:hypothetical protein [Thermosulfurimonas dismutans]OAQ21153.1 hypothetical protein TDIS_0805 [Thermosulfurimonas dismutans]